VASCFGNILGIDSGGSGFDCDALSSEVEYGSTGPDEFEVVKDAGSGSGDGKVRDEGWKGIGWVRPGSAEGLNVLGGVIDLGSSQHIA